LKNYKIQHLVLNHCDFRPTLYKNISRNRIFYYKCGPIIARKIHEDINQIAILSEKKISIKEAKEIMISFSDKKWKLLNLNTSKNFCENENCLANFMVLNAY
jgi:hypothetical protein